MSLVSPGADGAILLRVAGPGFGTPTATGSATLLHWRSVSETEIIVAVFGIINAGELFRVEVPDGRVVAQYQGTVIEVANQADALRTDLVGYALSITAAD